MTATRSIALLLTVFTGFTALVYEVTWQKYLATLLGSHSEATAAVLGIFLGGLALGYALFGHFTRRLVSAAQAQNRRPRLLAWYGLLEAGIGVYALLFPLLFLVVQALSVRIPHAVGGLGFVFDVILAMLLIGPPTVLMGGTIPFLTQALARDLDDATRVHAFVYAFNTVGAFAGALLAGFVLVPQLGLVAVMLAMGVVNLAVGAVFFGLDKRAAAMPTLPAAGGAAPQVRGFAAYAAVALLVGFAMMTVQTAVIRLGAQSFGSSDLTFAMVVSVFVLCIALGSFAVSALPRVPRMLLLINQWALVLALIWLYARLPDGPYLAHRLRILFTTAPDAFLLYRSMGFLGLLGLLAAPVLLSGASLPLLFDHLRHEVGDLGAVAGRLYSWNTVGSFLGALLGGYWLLFSLDLHEVFRLAVVAVGIAAVVVGLLYRGTVAVGLTAMATALTVALLVQLPDWRPERISPGLFRAWQALSYSREAPDSFFEKWWGDTTLPFYRDDPAVSVLVTESRQPDVGIVRSVLVNGKSDSATHGDNPTTGLLGVLPALFAQKAERSFVIGYGTGFTVGELAALDEAREVVVAEISTGVIDAAHLFDEFNGNASQSPKVRIVNSDAYRALLRSRDEYDVIVSEPSNPWVTGVEMLYSREFLRAAKRRLAPGGVFCQWFHQYATDRESVELVLRTYREVFEHVSVWHGLGRDLLLLGFDDPALALDLERLEARAAQPDFVAGLERSEVDSFAGLLAHEIMPLGVLHTLELEGPVQTLLHPRLNDMAARAYFENGVGELPWSGTLAGARVGAQNSLLRRYLEDPGAGAPADAREAAALESCRHRSRLCTALFARWLVVAGGATQDYQAAISRARNESARAFGGRFNPNGVSALVGAFLSGGPLPEQVALRDARRATRALRRYFHHAVPIDAERLLAIWERCVPGDEAPDACQRGLADARELLGVDGEGGADLAGAG